MKATGALKSTDATVDFGKRLAELMQPGDVVLLTGDLGAGKTTLTRAIAHALGTQATVSSPTYVIAHEYPAPKAPILHLDAYRLSGSRELFELGLDDKFSSAISLIEWGDRVESAFPNALRLALAHHQTDEDIREVELTAPPFWHSRASDLETAVTTGLAASKITS